MCGLHDRETGTGIFIYTIIANSAGQGGRRTDFPPRQRVRLLQPILTGGWIQFLDHYGLSCFLGTYKFKMLTVKLLFCQIQSEDWLVTIDLKDAQFHV